MRALLVVAIFGAGLLIFPGWASAEEVASATAGGIEKGIKPVTIDGIEIPKTGAFVHADKGQETSFVEGDPDRPLIARYKITGSGDKGFKLRCIPKQGAPMHCPPGTYTLDSGVTAVVVGKGKIQSVTKAK